MLLCHAYCTTRKIWPSISALSEVAQRGFGCHQAAHTCISIPNRGIRAGHAAETEPEGRLPRFVTAAEGVAAQSYDAATGDAIVAIQSNASPSTQPTGSSTPGLVGSACNS